MRFCIFEIYGKNKYVSYRSELKSEYLFKRYWLLNIEIRVVKNQKTAKKDWDEIDVRDVTIGTPLTYIPGDLKTRKSTGTSCQIEIHFSI